MWRTQLLPNNIKCPMMQTALGSKISDATPKITIPPSLIRKEYAVALQVAKVLAGRGFKDTYLIRALFFLNSFAFRNASG